VTTIEETAVRAATLLSTAMNMPALLQSPTMLEVSDPVELRGALVWLAEEMSWFKSAVDAGTLAGSSLPPDADGRLERLRVLVDAWDPGTPLPRDVRDAACDCAGMLQGQPAPG
jgi:hypothetical protein